MHMRTKKSRVWMLVAIVLACCMAIGGCGLLPGETTEPSANLKADENTVRVHVLDVGQGDSIFLEVKGTTMLIDAGNAKDGEDIIAYIQRLGYEKLDIVVATHPHADHIGGMAEVLEAFDVGQIYMPKVAHDSKTFENLLETIEEKGLTIQTAQAGKQLLSGEGLSAEIISPKFNEYSSLNNYSAVVKLIFENTSFLFMGDAESEVEDELEGITADFLKVAHHGSSTSSSLAFLTRVSPQIAVISVGEGNSYGHPNQETLDNLAQVGAEVFLTMDEGTLVFDSDGASIWRVE